MCSLSNIIINPFLEYSNEVASTFVFGLGYYLFRRLKNNSGWKDQKEEENKLKIKMINAIERWEYASTIEQYHQLIVSTYIGTNSRLVLKKISEKGLIPNIDIYNSLLLNCYLNKNVDEATMLREEIFEVRGPVTPNNYTLNILLKGLNLKYLNLLENQSCNLESLKQTYDTELYNIINKLEELDIFMDVHSQNTILESLIDQNRLDDAWCQYQNMKKFFEPNMFTYSTILKGIKKMNEAELSSEWLDRAFYIFEEANSYFEIDEKFFNTLLEASVKFNNLESAESLFEEIKRTFEKKNEKVSENTYGIMIKAYGKSYKLTKCIELFDYLKQNGKLPGTSVYSCMIQVLVSCKSVEKAEELFNEMIENNIERNIFIYLSLLNSYRVNKKIEKAIELYNQLQNELNIEINTVFYNSILDCSVDSNKIDLMNTVYQDFKLKACDSEENAQPDQITYSILLKGYIKANNVDKVSDIYDFISRRKDIKLDEILYNSIFDLYSKQGDETKMIKIYNNMKKNGIKMSIVSYGLLIKLYCNEDNFNKAFEVFEECIKCGVKPNVIIYHLLIKSQIKAGFMDRANTLVRNMSLQDIKPDSKLYELIINANLKNIGREPEAIEFTSKAIQENIIIPIMMITNVVDRLLKTDVLKFYEKKDLVRDLYYLMKAKNMLEQVQPVVLEMIDDYLKNKFKGSYNLEYNRGFNNNQYTNELVEVENILIFERPERFITNKEEEQCNYKKENKSNNEIPKNSIYNTEKYNKKLKKINKYSDNKSKKLASGFGYSLYDSLN